MDAAKVAYLKNVGADLTLQLFSLAEAKSREWEVHGLDRSESSAVIARQFMRVGLELLKALYKPMPIPAALIPDGLAVAQG